jgi:hypothetical protein
MSDNFFRWIYLSDIILKGNMRFMQGNVLKEANVEQDVKILQNQFQLEQREFRCFDKNRKKRNKANKPKLSNKIYVFNCPPSTHKIGENLTICNL